MFEDVFKLDSRKAPAEPFARVSRPPQRHFSPGVYSGGLVTLLGESFSRDWMEDWPPFVGRLEPFAYTAFGDLFCWDSRKDCPQFVAVQYAKMTRAAADSIDQLLDEGLVKADVIEELLRRDLVEDLKRLHGPLEYGECYIARPWEMLGGGGKPETFERGAVDVYLSMVGQTHPFE